MKCLVVYMSKYGSTRRYAERISQRLDCELVQHAQVTESMIAHYDVVILGSCILEGKIEESALYEQWIINHPEIHWILFTVGLSNPSLTNFSKLMGQCFTQQALDALTSFHFRGTIVYKRLEFVGLLMQQLEATKADSFDVLTLGEVERNLLERYGTTYDWREADSIEPLITYANQLEQ